MRFLLVLSLALVIGEFCQAIDFNEQVQHNSSKIHRKAQIKNKAPISTKPSISDKISQALMKFTLDIDRAIDELSDNKYNNLLISPPSLTTVLAIVLLGSAGKTFDEVTKALYFDFDKDVYKNSEKFHKALGDTIMDYNKKQNKTLPIYELATGLFIQDGYPIHDQFKLACKKIYESDIIKVDFAQNTLNAQNLINEWMSTQTEGKIKKLLLEPPWAQTRVIISSAMYFKGSWNKEFGYIKERVPFKIEKNETIQVTMMMKKAVYPFHEVPEKLKIIGLPYKGLETVMYLIRPTAPGTAGLLKLKRQLTPEFLDDLLEKMEDTEVIMGVPKMKLSSSTDLRPALRALNVTSLFDPSAADLSIISPGFGNKVQPVKTEKGSFGIDELRNRKNLKNPQIHVEGVIHAVEMSINEKGTEASGSTSMDSISRSMSPTFYANKPFLLFIRHNPTKKIWFWGSINRPVND